MKEIKLTMGQVAIIDDEDYELAIKYKWHSQKHNSKSKTYYYACTNTYFNGKHRVLSMHRLILNINDPKINIDHIDGNSLLNTKSNLRIATDSQNAMNMNNQIGTSSKFKGVSYRPDRNKFTAKIKINYKSIHIGSFDNEIDAALAYDKKAIEIFGEYAKINF